MAVGFLRKNMTLVSMENGNGLKVPDHASKAKKPKKPKVLITVEKSNM